jgi:L-lactate utilization protein LutC
LRKAGATIRECITREEAMKYVEGNFPNSNNLMNPETKGKYGEGASNEELEKTEVVIMEGQFGVAENGAVWVDEANFPHRLLPFVTRQLVLVLDQNKIVSTMHEAYQRLDLRETGFGVFISGPSKTADIEQSLVYGAHGAKKMTVMLLVEEKK